MRMMEKGKMIVEQKNEGKIREFEGLIGKLGLEVSQVEEIGMKEKEEKGKKFEEKEYIKEIEEEKEKGFKDL